MPTKLSKHAAEWSLVHWGVSCVDSAAVYAVHGRFGCCATLYDFAAVQGTSESFNVESNFLFI